MEMKAVLDRLEETLSSNIELYSLMERELAAEREAITSHSFGELGEAVRRKSAVAMKIHALEKTRLSLVRKLAGVTNIPESEITLSKLAGLVGGAAGARILAIRARIREAVARADEMNEFNRGLIERSMALNYHAAMRLQELVSPEATYAKDGAAKGALKAGRVVSRKL